MTSPRRAWIAALLGCLMAVTMSACAADSADTPAQDVRAVEGDPFLSQDITVSGRVADVYADRGFLLSGDDVSFGEGAGTLVLGAEAGDVEAGAYARVRGSVTMLDVGDEDSPLVSRYGRDFLIGFDGEYVVAARTVEVVDRDDGGVAALEAALNDPTAEVRETLTVAATVDEVVSPRVFSVGRGDAAVVVLAAHRPEIDAGDVVEMTGTVVPFDPPSLASRSGIILRSDVADQVRQRVGDGMVFVAESTTLVNVQKP